MKEKLRRILPHAAILLSNMYIVFFLIDRVNTAMQFINNSITKALLLILCIISTVNASFLIVDARNRDATRRRRQSSASGSAGSEPRATRSAQAASPAHTASGARTARTTSRPAATRSSAASGQRKASSLNSGHDAARQRRSS